MMVLGRPIETIAIWVCGYCGGVRQQRLENIGGTFAWTYTVNTIHQCGYSGYYRDMAPANELARSVDETNRRIAERQASIRAAREEELKDWPP